MSKSWECHCMVKNGDMRNLEYHFNLYKINPDLKFQNETLLTTAIKAGSQDIVKFLLKRGADPNFRSSENGRNEPPIVTATRYKNFEIVKILVDTGADINRTVFLGHDAIFQAVVENACKILTFLLQRVSSMESTHPLQNCPFLTALKYAEKYSYKRQCLFILICYHYECNCFQEEMNHQMSSKSSLIYIKPPFNYDRLIFCKTLISTEALIRVTFINTLTLKSLARSSIRKTVFSITSKQHTNYCSLVTRLPLPKTLIDFVMQKSTGEKGTVTRLALPNDLNINVPEKQCTNYLIDLG